MTFEEILQSPDFKQCREFHGHLCPGLSLGYKAARSGLDILREKRSEDEEVVAIVETDACGADAVQVLTGCTFGKGNFLYRDYGKTAFTFFSRRTGQGVRLCLKPGAFEPDEEHMALLQKVIQGRADEQERQRFEELHHQRSCDILAMQPDELFDIREVREELPEKARIAPSVTCGLCGEPTMSTKMETKDGKQVCRACAEGSDGNRTRGDFLP